MGTVLRGFAVMALVASVAAAPPGPAAAADARYAVPVDDSPAIGAPGAPVVIVEFLDYQ